MANATVTIHFEGGKDLANVKTLTIENSRTFEHIILSPGTGIATDRAGLRAIRDAINEHLGE